MNILLRLGAMLDPPRRWDLGAHSLPVTAPVGTWARCVLLDRRGALWTGNLLVHKNGEVVANPGTKIWRESWRESWIPAPMRRLVSAAAGD